MPQFDNIINDPTGFAIHGQNDTPNDVTAPGGSGVYGHTTALHGTGVFGWARNPTAGRGVQGNGEEAGVGGFSNRGVGVLAQSNYSDGLRASTTSEYHSAVFGSNNSHAAVPATPGSKPGGIGVFGLTVAPGGLGVLGANTSRKGRGVQGNGPEAGVGGFSETGDGVLAQTRSSQHSGIFAVNDSRGDAPGEGPPGGNGVFGLTNVRGGTGVFGANNSDRGRGVQGNGPEAGVAGYSEKGVGVLAQSGEDGTALRVEGKAVFDGSVSFTRGIGGTLHCFDVILDANSADCAEEFDLAAAERAAPGTVMVLDDTGALRPSDRAYDRRVAGVVSGGGSYRPGIVLDRDPSRTSRTQIALIGKVYCMADADAGPIGVGDLLTTSDTPGHAMRARDQDRSFGAVIGKALQPLKDGTGLIPILVCLQ